MAPLANNAAALRAMRESVRGYVAARRRFPRRAPTAREQRMADNMHALLSETFDAASLPNPDLRANPNAGVALGDIIVSGTLPGESSAPGAQGFIWLWPAVAVVGIVAFTITMKIRSDADVEKERIEAECIASGACTDSSFWIKAAGIAVLGYGAWEFFLKKKLRKNPGRARKARVWVVQQNYGYGHGWETVTVEDSRRDAMDRVREYRENNNYPTRAVQRSEAGDY